MTFGERLTQARNIRGYSQKAFAELLDITPTRLNYWEKDKREPDLSMMWKIVSSLNISAAWLLSGEGEMEKKKVSVDYFDLANEVGVSSPGDVDFKSEEDLLQYLKYKLSSEEKDDYYSSQGDDSDHTPITLTQPNYGGVGQNKKAPATQNDESDIQKQRLIHNFDILNPDGRTKLVAYSDDLAEIPKYTEEDTKKKYRVIPYSTIAASAGAGEDIDDNSWENITIPDISEYRQADFAVRVHGNSMQPDYEDGDTVLVRQQDVIGEGAVGLFWVKGKGGVIKKMGRGELISLNPEYENIVYDTDKGRCFGKIIGKLEKE